MRHELKRWYVYPCFVGEDCWCRCITSKEGSDAMEDCIVPSGSMNKETAEWIVKLNNEAVDRHASVTEQGQE